MLKNMKIGTRLGVANAILFALALTIGVVAIIALGNVNARVTRLAQGHMPSVRLSNDVIDNVNVVARAVRNMALAEDQATRDRESARIDEASRVVTDTLAKLEPLEQTEAGKAKLRAVHQARGEYLPVMRQARQLALEGKTKEASAVILGPLRGAQTAYVDAVTALIQNDYVEADAAAAQAQQEYASGRSLMIGLLVFAAIAAAVAAVASMRSITDPLKACVDAANRVAAGDTNVALDTDRKDELGALMVAMQRMVDNVSAAVGDVALLTKSAKEGKLNARADASRHEGDFRTLVQGVNDTLDAVVNPLNVAANYVDRIAKGDIPPKITDSYNGDFNTIKNNLNTCIDAINLLIADTAMLSKAAVDGKLSTRADASRHQGDYRKIVQGINETLDLVLAPINDALKVLEALANSDLRARMQGSYQGDHARMKEYVNRMADALHEALAQVAEATDQVSSASAQIASSSQAISQGATEQASSLEETSSTLEEISSMTKQNADNTQQARALAQATKGAADSGSVAMSRMMEAMRRIRESAEGTAVIIADINEIAFQTNLLALNAAVEAARAGDAGRGFAVVAEEVRNLALRSKEAAKKTDELIKQSVKLAEEGEVITNEVNGNLSEIVSSVGKVTDIVGEIAVASQEQARGIDQVNKAVSQMEQVVQQAAANSEETSSAAEELASQAQGLAAMVGAFQLNRSISRTSRQAFSASSASRHHAPSPAKKKNGGNGGKTTLSVRPEDVIPLESDPEFSQF